MKSVSLIRVPVILNVSTADLDELTTDFNAGIVKFAFQIREFARQVGQLLIGFGSLKSMFSYVGSSTSMGSVIEVGIE